ncbi:hypothetical protein GCM10027346_24120 [Hymenobacter seoulensis]
MKRKDYKSFLDHLTIPDLKLSYVKTVDVNQVEAIKLLLNKVSKLEDVLTVKIINESQRTSYIFE